MKKTISINIGGIIFHIEEDGYEKLKSYLESVNKYFSTFDDSSEIIADIESRIAEIFLAKLSDGRQTLFLEDVTELIQTMGTTKDFEESLDSDDTTKKEEAPQPEAPKTETGPKRLFRDTKRKIVGGVAAGIAHYFGIDPLWIRLVIVGLFINIIFWGLSGATLLAYIICWIVIPPSGSIEEDKKIKKLFRNSDERVLGGVASGIAAYFGIDIAVVRLLFVLSLFVGGAGFLVYIVLWIITPEAKTITQKMEMQGEPVTLSNIEENVKKSLRVDEGEENMLVKILLFPFRLIALIINGIGKILGPILKFAVDLIRIAFGVILMTVGLAIMIALILALVTLVGFGPFYDMVLTDVLPIDLLQRSLEPWTLTSLFLVIFIPVLAISLLGLVVILKRRVASPIVGWSLFALWILALAGASILVPKYTHDFKEEGSYHYTRDLPLTEGTPKLFLNNTSGMHYDGVELRLRAHQDSSYQLSVKVESRGRDRDDAIQNAKQVTYLVNRKGEDFYFDQELTFPDSSKFRFQTAEVTFYVPYGKVFQMDGDLDEILINTLHLNGYRAYEMEGNDWVFDESGIKCLTCNTDQSTIDDADEQSGSTLPGYENADEMTFPFDGFDELKVEALFDLDVKRGDTYEVRIRGEKEDLDEVYLNQVGDRLEVRFKEDNWKWWKDNQNSRIKLSITMPNLTSLEVAGACNGEVTGFEEENMDVEILGASDLYMNVIADALDVSIAGASELKLRGTGTRLEADVVGASSLHSLDFKTELVNVEAMGASKAMVYGSKEIEAKAGGVSSIKYSGPGDVNSDSDTMSSVSRY